MPAMISRIDAAKFIFSWLIYRRVQTKREIWLKIRLLTVRLRTVGLSAPYTPILLHRLMIPRD
jgi:hypothetical protein